jgi:post-GPI attachment to proteins factor 3
LLQNHEEYNSLLNDRNCVQQCEMEGVAGGIAIPHCTNETIKGVWYTKEPLNTQWRQLNCRADCRYHCMMQREQERRLQGLKPVKYHGKWPFLRVFVFQVPIIPGLVLFTCVKLFMFELPGMGYYGPIWHIIPFWYLLSLFMSCWCLSALD